MGLPVGREFSLLPGGRLGERTGLAFFVEDTNPPTPSNDNIEIKHVPAGSKYYIR